MAWLVIGGGVILVVLAIMISRTRVPHDGVDNFRRQIDALSPEARRPTVGRVDEARHKRRDDDGTRRPVSSVTPARGVDRRPADDSNVNPRPRDEAAGTDAENERKDANQSFNPASDETSGGPDRTDGSDRSGLTGEVPENPDSGGGSFDGT